MPDLSLMIRANQDAALLTWAELITLQLRFLDADAKTELGMVGRYKTMVGDDDQSLP